MSLIVPNVSKIPMLKIWTLEQAPGQLKMHLFKNDYTPVAGTTLANLTEADFTGYAAADMDNPVTQPALDGGNRSWVIWDAITWTKNGATGNTIFGYYVLDNPGNLLWAERFVSGGYAMTVDGTPLQLTPLLTLRSQFGNA